MPDSPDSATVGICVLIDKSLEWILSEDSTTDVTSIPPNDNHGPASSLSIHPTATIADIEGVNPTLSELSWIVSDQPHTDQHY